MIGVGFAIIASSPIAFLQERVAHRPARRRATYFPSQNNMNVPIAEPPRLRETAFHPLSKVVIVEASPHSLADAFFTVQFDAST
jgi:hypothetical protein